MVGRSPVYELSLERFCTALRKLAVIREVLQGIHQDQTLSEGAKTEIVEVLVNMRKECEPLTFKSSIGHIDRITSDIASYSINSLGNHIAELGRRIRDDCEGVRLLYVSPVLERFYFEPTGAYKESVITNFPEVKVDVEEAGKCLALERFTACVYHAMRIAEHGLRSLAGDLGIDLGKADKSTWGQIIQECEHKIKADMQSISLSKRTKEQQERLQFYSDAAIQMRYFKDAWRDDVAHVRATYTQEQAQIIYDSVRHFMTQLSDRRPAANLGQSHQER
jgi:hypothetical protein